MEKFIRTSMFLFGLLLVVFGVYYLTLNKFQSLQSALAKDPEIVTTKERYRQLECLARNIYHEAATESFEGKVAVAQVTINRANSGRFPKDICAVVYQKTVFAEKVICQFSWFCERHSLTKMIHKHHYDESYEVAKKVLLEGFRLPSLKDALFYHADYIPDPGWSQRYNKITSIGRHIFYAER